MHWVSENKYSKRILLIPRSFDKCLNVFLLCLEVFEIFTKFRDIILQRILISVFLFCLCFFLDTHSVSVLCQKQSNVVISLLKDVFHVTRSAKAVTAQNG